MFYIYYFILETKFHYNNNKPIRMSFGSRNLIGFKELSRRHWSTSFLPAVHTYIIGKHLKRVRSSLRGLYFYISLKYGGDTVTVQR